MIRLSTFYLIYLVWLKLSSIECSATSSKLINEKEPIQLQLADLKNSPYKLCNPRDNLTFYNHTPFSYLHKNEDICNGSVDMLFYVQSSLKNFDRRQIIRQTFGSQKQIHGYNTRLMFLVGQSEDNKSINRKFMNEINHYHDVVQADFKDTYKNLTLKHIVALHWIHYHCPNAKYVSKSDDDTLINPFNMVYHLFSTINNHKNAFILGQISNKETPIRKKGFKWTVDNETYSENTYPPFTKGFGYIMSQAAIRPLLICSYYQKFLYIDDVFITGLVVRKSGVKLINFDTNFRKAWTHHLKKNEDIDDFIYLISPNYYTKSVWLKLWHQMILHQMFL